MNTATTEAPAELDLVAHVWDDDQTCRDPERIKLKVPKGCICEIRLANAPGQGWFIGYGIGVGKTGGTDTYPCSGRPGYLSRSEALGAALATARDFFQASPKSKLHKKCAGEVIAYAKRVAAGLPANNGATAKVKPGPLPEPEYMDLPVKRVEQSFFSDRGEVSADDVGELVETIKSQGLLQPIGVRVIQAPGGLPGIEDSKIEIMWGRRRLKAFEVLNRETVPCRVYKDITDEQARLVMTIENVERKDIDPIKQAKNYAAMMADFDMTQDDVAVALKKSRPVIANAMRWLELPVDVQEWMASGVLSASHGTALCRFKDWPAICSRIAHVAVHEKSSAGALETGLPFDSDLVSGGLVVRIAYHTELSPAQRKDPDYFKDGYGWFCFNPEKWRQAQKDAAAGRREKKKLAAQKESAKEAKQKKEKKEYFAGVNGEAVDDYDKHLLLAVPDDKQLIGRRSKWDSSKCTLVTDKQLWTTIKETAAQIVAADRVEKLTPVFAKAWKFIEGLKKVDGWCVALLCGTNTQFEPADFVGEVAKRLKLDLAKDAKKVFVPAGRGESVLKLNALAACDSVEVVKLVAGAVLDGLEEKFKEDRFFSSSDEAWLAFAAGGMDREDLELLTKDEVPHKVIAALLPKPGDRAEWGDERGNKDGTSSGVIITPEDYEKGTGAKWDFEGATPVKRDKSLFGDPFGAIVTEAIRVVSRAKVEPAAKIGEGAGGKAAKKVAKKAKKGGSKK